MPNSEKDFLTKLDKHPRLKKRFYEILNIAENSSGDLSTADEVELKTIEEVRKLGREVIEDWAIEEHSKKVQAIEKNSSTRKHGKKNSFGKQPLA